MKIGITGGIGSGKSYVSKIFGALGVPCYDADMEAKRLMNNDLHIREALVKAFGPQVYGLDGLIDRAYLSALVFRDREKLDLLNGIVHPAVIRHAEDWAEAQTHPYSLKEAALLFESGSYRLLDRTILVSAPEEERIRRVMQRDGATKAEVVRRIEKQMPEEEKAKLADFVIVNDGQTPLLPQVLKINGQLTMDN